MPSGAKVCHWLRRLKGSRGNATTQSCVRALKICPIHGVSDGIYIHSSILQSLVGSISCKTGFEGDCVSIQLKSRRMSIYLFCFQSSTISSATH